MKIPGGINIELTSRCNKACGMCGRRKLEKEHPQLCQWGDMPLEMVYSLAMQIPEGTIIQLHNNGEPTLYPELGRAISYFSHCVTGLNTNAKLLTAVAHELTELNSLTISIIPDDPEGKDQLLNVQSYLEMDITRPSNIVFRFLDWKNIDQDLYNGWLQLYADHINTVKVATRILHSPHGSFDYKQMPVKPEMGICLEALTKLSIDRYGFVSPCVRFDPFGEHRVGHVGDAKLLKIVNSEKNIRFRNRHLWGQRAKASPVCKACDYWGIPRG